MTRKSSFSRINCGCKTCSRVEAAVLMGHATTVRCDFSIPSQLHKQCSQRVEAQGKGGRSVAPKEMNSVAVDRAATL
jgi:hypothetical protein